MISIKQSPNLNPQIDQLQKRMDAWRKSHRPRARIPGRLWDAAVQVARQCGLNRTAKALHLDYYDLKKRLDAASTKQGTIPSFIELSAAVPTATAECVIELETRNSSKMRIHMKGMGMPDLNALSEAFWRSKL
jgi:hypothetical protein